jgi:hypothetical protein
MDAVLQALADPTVREGYLLFCFALMILPMIGLAWWYHSRIRNTAGGRALMGAQQRHGVSMHRNDRGAAIGNLRNAVGMAKGISAGRYGGAVRRMQNLTYLIIGIWVVVLIVAFGILVWADEVNRVAG